MSTIRDAIKAMKWLTKLPRFKREAALNTGVLSDEILDRPVGPQFKNKFNSLPAIMISDHFKILIDKKHLDEDQLSGFFISAFQEMKPPDDKLTFANIKTKRKIISLFFDFYNLSGKPYGQKERYAALLGEYFSGFETKTVLQNFRN